MRKRIFSILLTIAVCLSMMPAGVWAADGETSGQGKNSEHNHCICGGTENVNGHSHHTDLNFQPWDSTDALPDKGSYYLTESVTMSGTWSPTGEVVLCLNGQTISGSINVGTGAALTPTDCTAKGKIQGSNSAVGVTVNGGTFNMYGGTITDGGGVYVGEKCSFTMDGGNITGNTATAGNGGGIYIHNLATKAEISNALITNNKATATGNVSFGLGGGIYSQKNLTVNNSAITGNEATYYGGGICGAGSITLNSTVVTGNKSTKGNGGGMYTSKMSSTSVTNQPLSISGSTQIKDNAPNNYHVNEARQLPINVTAALTDSAVIYVDVYEGLKPDYNSTLTIAEPKSGVTLDASNFKADAADCVTGVDENGKVYLALCEHKMGNTGYTCEK